jgi:hypothetical protein
VLYIHTKNHHESEILDKSIQSGASRTCVVSANGKTRRFDHPSLEYDKLFKHQITRPLALSTRIGPKWSRGPFFPFILPAGKNLHANHFHPASRLPDL